MNDTVMQDSNKSRFRLQGFQLDEHPRAIAAVVLFFIFAAYAYVDAFITADDGYATFPPYWIFAAAAIVVGVACFFWLYRGAVPRNESAGLAIIVAIAFGCALYPGLLRISNVVGDEQYISYVYQLDAERELRPADANLPILDVPLNRQYWSEQVVGETWNIELKRGVFGFWMYHARPLQEEIDVYTLRQAIVKGLLEGLKQSQ